MTSVELRGNMSVEFCCLVGCCVAADSLGIVQESGEWMAAIPTNFYNFYVGIEIIWRSRND